EPCAVARSPGERLLRAVLQAWDFRDPQGLRPVLRRAAAQLGLVDEAGAVERGVGGVIGSKEFAPPGRAVECHRELEFLMPWPGRKAPAGLKHRPAVRGVIDCAWQDARQGWHLLCLRLSSPAPHTDNLAKLIGTVPRSVAFWVHAAKHLF